MLLWPKRDDLRVSVVRPPSIPVPHSILIGQLVESYLLAAVCQKKQSFSASILSLLAPEAISIKCSIIGQQYIISQIIGFIFNVSFWKPAIHVQPEIWSAKQYNNIRNSVYSLIDHSVAVGLPYHCCSFILVKYGCCPVTNDPTVGIITSVMSHVIK